jgi:hypothetical protein
MHTQIMTMSISHGSNARHCPAAPNIAQYHNRMPVVLDDSQLDDWMRDTPDQAAALMPWGEARDDRQSVTNQLFACSMGTNGTRRGLATR